VGALNAINGIAQAYVERLPLVVISGSPGHKERQGSMFAHHTIVDHGTQLRLMQEVTVHQACIEDPHQAQEQLREAIAIALHESRPVYIEIPRDLFLHKVRHTLGARPRASTGVVRPTGAERRRTGIETARPGQPAGAGAWPGHQALAPRRRSLGA
jgi:indolepyruvate decarboxylase